MSRSIKKLKLDKVFKKLQGLVGFRITEDHFKNIKISGPYHKYDALLDNEARILLMSEDDLEQKTCNHITRDFWDYAWRDIQAGAERWDSFMNENSNLIIGIPSATFGGWSKVLHDSATFIAEEIEADTPYGLATSYESLGLNIAIDDYIKQLLYYEGSMVNWLTDRDDLLDDEYLQAKEIIEHIEKNNLKRGNSSRVDKELLEKVMLLLDHSDEEFQTQGLMLLKDFDDPNLTAAVYEEWYPYWDITQNQLDWLDALPDYDHIMDKITVHIEYQLVDLIDPSQPYTMWRTHIVGATSRNDPSEVIFDLRSEGTGNITNFLDIKEDQINWKLCKDIDLSERLDLDFYDLDWEPKKLIKVDQVMIIMG